MLPIGDLRRLLQAPETELIETHISLVFLRGDEVFKVKKPVDLGFLDFSSLEKRRRACDAEVRLNRRLAPEVYLGVVPITLDRDGKARFGGEGEAVDWAVQMKRLPVERRTDELLRQGRLQPADLQRIAEHLARFHQQARADEATARFGTTEAIAVNVKENFEQTETFIHDYVSAGEATEIQTWQLEFLARNRDLFERRQELGRVRDGHGDLRLEHVYLSADEVQVIDCIEFNQRFRFADVCADIAFLSMDLTWQGEPGLAESFLAAYARAANDFDLYLLVDFYESYRAYVRGKVSAFMAADSSLEDRRREQIRAEARRYFLLALAASRRSLEPPRVIAVGGVIASGKSTVAEALATELHAPVIDADRTRKDLLGVAPEEAIAEDAWQGAYSAQMSARVYAELIRRAEAVLRSGRSVVLDASFRTRAYRELARRLAVRHRVPFRFVECQAPLELCRERLEERRKKRSVSDGRLEIFDAFVQRYEAVDELPLGESIRLDTSRPLSENLRRLVDP